MSKPLPIGPDTPYLDPRLDKKMFKQYLDNPEVDMKGQCESCKTPTSKRCSKCKALAVCSPECFKAVWKKHKADCTKLAAAAANAPQGHFPKGIPFVLSSGTDEMQLLGTINKETMDLYVRHGIDGDPPEGDSLLSDQKLAAFFADMLELNDSGSDSHKDYPLPVKLFMNRRYNNTYVHLINKFKTRPVVIDTVHWLCRQRKIGDASR